MLNEIHAKVPPDQNSRLIVQMYQNISVDGANDETSVLSAAAAQITQFGLKGLTLRSLAQETGISASLLTYRYGSRDRLLQRVFEEAGRRNREDWAQLDRTLAGMARTPAALPAIAMAVATHRSNAAREIALLDWISVIAGQRDTQLAPSTVSWPSPHSRFWASRFEEAGLDPGPGHAFAAGLEGAVRIGLIAPADPRAAAWISDLVTRLCERIRGAGPSRPGDSPARAAIEQAGHGTGTGDESRARTPTPDRIVEAAARLILSAGPDALTHRAIAVEAGVSLSSMTHHFATLDDIMLRAFDRIYDRASTEASTGLTRTHTISSLSRSVLPGISRRFRTGGHEHVAMEEIMLFTSRKPALAAMAPALLAMSGRTSTALLKSVSHIGAKADRLDGQIFRFVLTGLHEEAAHLPLGERETWSSDACERFLLACWPED